MRDERRLGGGYELRVPCCGFWLEADSMAGWLPPWELEVPVWLLKTYAWRSWRTWRFHSGFIPRSPRSVLEHRYIPELLGLPSVS